MGCESSNEQPLTLPQAAEPSAKMYNDRGIDFYIKGDLFEALISFNQAKTADHTAGEIHFNLALVLHNRGEKKRALKHFKLARQFAQGNPKILNSDLLKQYLKTKNGD